MPRSLHLGPILRQLRGHRAAAFLVTLQLAVGTVIALTGGQIGLYMNITLRQRTGLAENDLSLVSVRLPGARAGGPDDRATRETLLAEVRATPGVVAAAVAAAPPMALPERTPDELAVPGRPAAPMPVFEMGIGDDGATTLGLELLAGRDFTAADLGATPLPAILPREVTERLFPGEDPIGRRFESRSRGPAVVVGVVGAISLVPGGVIGSRRAVLYAAPPTSGARILVLARSRPGEADAVRARLRDGVHPPAGAMVAVSDLLAVRRAVKVSMRAGIGVVSMIMAAIVLVVVLGSVALTYTLVTRRTREIGLRRALGARRGEVVAHFVVENALFSMAGLTIAMGLFAPMVMLMRASQEGFHVHWWLVVLTLATLAALNLAATLIPAWKAARVPPSAAARSQEERWARS
jgi:putative ABC transport system permease protein